MIKYLALYYYRSGLYLRFHRLLLPMLIAAMFELEMSYFIGFGFIMMPGEFTNTRALLFYRLPICSFLVKEKQNSVMHWNRLIILMVAFTWILLASLLIGTFMDISVPTILDILLACWLAILLGALLESLTWKSRIPAFFIKLLFSVSFIPSLYALHHLATYKYLMAGILTFAYFQKDDLLKKYI